MSTHPLPNTQYIRPRNGYHGWRSRSWSCAEVGGYGDALRFHAYDKALFAPPTSQSDCLDIGAINIYELHPGVAFSRAHW